MTGAIKTKNPNSSWIIKGNNSPPTHGSGLLRHAYVLFNRENPMRLIAFKGGDIKKSGNMSIRNLYNCRDN